MPKEREKKQERKGKWGMTKQKNGRGERETNANDLKRIDEKSKER